MKIGIYPGSFDPITNGHLDIIERACSLFDKIIVGVISQSENKNFLFNNNERFELVRNSTVAFDNVEVELFNGLLIDYVHSKKSNAIIRGLRAISDFEYEFQMALMNRKLNSKINTVFLMPDQKYIHISSSLVKEVASLGGDISSYVPENVLLSLNNKYK